MNLRLTSLFLCCLCTTEAFLSSPTDASTRTRRFAEETDSDVSNDVLESLLTKLDTSKEKVEKKVDNKAMSFLKKVGKVGGANNKNFVNAVGSDEGSAGRQPPVSKQQPVRKSQGAYQECATSGVIDDLTESFPLTSSGTEWRGVSDRVMGGVSNGFIQRKEDLEGKAANVLTGHVSLANSGGFIQMVTDLPLNPAVSSVDASDFDGIEIDVLCRGQTEFNIHLRTPGTLQQASYRHTVTLEKENEWELVRIPFSSFEPHRVREPLDITTLKRIGIVVIGEEMDVFVAVAGLRFYSVF